MYRNNGDGWTALQAAIPYLSDGGVTAFVQPDMMRKRLFGTASGWRTPTLLAAMPRSEACGRALRVHIGLRALRQVDGAPRGLAVDVENATFCTLAEGRSTACTSTATVALLGHLQFCASIARRFGAIGKLSVTISERAVGGGERDALLFLSGLLDALERHQLLRRSSLRKEEPTHTGTLVVAAGTRGSCGEGAHVGSMAGGAASDIPTASTLQPQEPGCNTGASLLFDALASEDPCLVLSWFEHRRVELKWAFQNLQTLAFVRGEQTSLACVRNVGTIGLGLVPSLTTWLSRGAPLASLVGLTASCPLLVVVDLSETRVTDSDLRLLSRLALLERAVLERCTEITSLDALVTMTRLRAVLTAGSERLSSFSTAVQRLASVFDGGSHNCRTAPLIEFSVSATTPRSLMELCALTTVMTPATSSGGHRGFDTARDVPNANLQTVVALERLAIHGAAMTERATPMNGSVVSRVASLRSLALINCPPWRAGIVSDNSGTLKAFASLFTSLTTLVLRDCDLIRRPADLTDVVCALGHLNDLVVDRPRVASHIDVTSSLQFLLLGGAEASIGQPRKWKRVQLRMLPPPHDVGAARNNLRLAFVKEFCTDWSWGEGSGDGLEAQWPSLPMR